MSEMTSKKGKDKHIKILCIGKRRLNQNIQQDIKSGVLQEDEQGRLINVSHNRRKEPPKTTVFIRHPIKK